MHRALEQATDSARGMPEPPEDFMDPITASLMQDPVTLPDSQVTLDRTTVERHLLSQVRALGVCLCEACYDVIRSRDSA